MDMSIRYNIAKCVLRMTGMRKLFSLPKEELFQKAAGYNKNRNFHIPKDHKYTYTDVNLGNNEHVLKIQGKCTENGKAMMFLFGGGMVIGPDDGDIRTAAKLAVPCGYDVWFPWYPLCPEHNMEDAADMILRVYGKMLDEYSAEHICFCGFSSGATLAITTCLHNLRQEKPCENPAMILACSPGAVPHCDEEWKEMDRLGEKDIMINPAFMKVMKDVMPGGRKMAEYLHYPSAADYTGMPTIHFWWGSNEVLYAEAPYFIQGCEKAGVPHTVEIGEGMCHCYPMVDFFPEGKKAQENMKNYLMEL